MVIAYAPTNMGEDAAKDAFYMMTSLNLVPNAHVCVYLMVHITKLQLQADENINIVIEFNPYMPKFSKSKTQAPNRNLQIILIIRHINVEPEKVVP